MSEANEPRKVASAELKQVVTDAGELSKGVRIFDDGGLAHLSRHGARLYADAAGSGASPYKVQLSLETDVVKARCSCMAARSRPYCKHAAALLVAWSRTPDAFVVSEAPPTPPAGDAKKARVKAGKVDVGAVMGEGVRQAATLVSELGSSGVASLAADRPAQVAGLATTLRENRLRRLSARTLELAEALGQGLSGAESFDATYYTSLFCDTVLTVRKLEKHLAGEALEPRHVEELIGKTWTKKDRTPAGPADLVEYAYRTRETADGFVVRESTFLDLKTGQHFAEKQVLPGFLAKRTPPKPSHAGRVLVDAGGSAYPSFAPVRLDLENPGTSRPLEPADLERMLTLALPDVTAALTAFQAQRKDVFAPDTMPACLRVDTLVADGARLQAVDANDGALFLPADDGIEDQLARVLRGRTLRALLGEVSLDGALPTLFPVAAIVEEAGRSSLVTVSLSDAATTLSSKKVKAATPTATGRRAGWVDSARAAGLSPAAIILGEVRDELAQGLVTGLASVSPRFADPLAARLQELGLAKPAALLTELAKRPDPSEKLDDFVKLYQVLGIALTRLAAATRIERQQFVPVPTFESVQVKQPATIEEPAEVSAAVARGTLNRYEAAARHAAWYARIPSERLAEEVFPTWGDGGAQPFVIDRLRHHPDLALAAATRVLLPSAGATRPTPQNALRPAEPGLPAMGRTATLTAFRLLEAVGTPECIALLKRDAPWRSDSALRGIAANTVIALRQRTGERVSVDPTWRKEVDEARNRLLNASQKSERAEAARSLADLGDVEGIPWLRASFQGDIATDVREEAALSLGRLGDGESLDTFVRLVRARDTHWDQAKAAVHALAALGDVRSLPVLADAWADNWIPGLVVRAIADAGAAGLTLILDRLEADPSLAKRSTAKDLLAALPAEETGREVHARLAATDEDELLPRAIRFGNLLKGNRVALGHIALALKGRGLEPRDLKGGKVLSKLLVEMGVA